MKRGLIAFAVLVCAVLVLGASAPSNRYFNGVIQLTGVPSFVPAGVDFDSNSLNFIMSSLSGAGLVALSTDQIDFGREEGNVEQYNENGDLVSTGGVYVDTPRNLVYTTNFRWPEPTTFGGLVGFVGTANIGNARASFTADFSSLTAGNKVVNDIAVDGDGHIYATESLGGAIFRVDRSSKSASVWKIDDALKPQDAGGLGVTGIAYFDGDGRPSERGFLLGRYGLTPEASGLFFVHLDSREVRRVEIDAPRHEDPYGFDGVALHADGTLWLVSPDLNLVYELGTEDRWETASLLKTYSSGCDFPTDLTIQGDQIYVLCSSGFGDGPYSLERINSSDDDDDAYNDDGDGASVSAASAIAPCLFVVACLLAFLV